MLRLFFLDPCSAFWTTSFEEATQSESLYSSTFLDTVVDCFQKSGTPLRVQLDYSVERLIPTGTTILPDGRLCGGFAHFEKNAVGYLFPHGNQKIFDRKPSSMKYHGLKAVAKPGLVIAIIICGSVHVFGFPHQTETFSEIESESTIPFRVSLQMASNNLSSMPTLHSMAMAQSDGKWLLVGGRTNGLHQIFATDLTSFPPSEQNSNLWVIDPRSGQSWSRPLQDVGLSDADIDFLSATNAQFAEHDGKLYVAGGYGYDSIAEEFVTYDGLASFDVEDVVNWVIDGSGAPNPNAVRITHDPAARVTGGVMRYMGDQFHLVFGQDFQGGYGPWFSGEYTNQVRSFKIVDDGSTLSIEDVHLTTPKPEYRRRDLNVLPVIRKDAGGGPLEEGLVALSGVFTEFDGGWTVPVEIDSSGNPSMADPTAPDTFKQAMNNYTTASLGFYSQESDEMHNILFGGISIHYVDEATGDLTRDDQLPFVNDVTDIVIDSEGNYSQHLLSTEFPLVTDLDGNRLRFGTNGEFIVAQGIPTYENGVLKLDELTEPTLLGYLYGGIAANQGNQGKTVASNLIFEVMYQPVPEPNTFVLTLLAASISMIAYHVKNNQE